MVLRKQDFGDKMDKKDSKAISFDTNPKYLRFQKMSSNPLDLGEGEGKIVADLGDSLDMTLIKTPGSVPGIVLNDLTGGTDRTIDVEIQAQVLNDSLTVDGFIGDITFTLDDASTLGPFTMTAGQITAIADSQGQGKFPSVGFNTVDLGWDLSGLSGHTIVSVSWTMNAFVGFPFAIANGLSSITMRYLPQPLTILTFNNVTISGPGSSAWIVGGWGVATPQFEIVASWDTADPNAIVHIPIDAATIKSLADGTALASDAWVDAPGHGDINWGNTYLNPYLGFNVIATSIGGSDDYGPAFDGTAVLAFSFNGITNNTGGPLTIGLPSTMQITLYLATGKISDVQAFLSMQGSLITWRVSTPLANNFIVTEPYELRLRNLPAFKLKFRTRVFEEGETPPAINFLCFVSQGDPENPYNNKHREWTIVPVSYFGSDGDIVIISYDNNSPVINVNPPISTLPKNYGGIIMLVSKLFIGPYNYIRFIITPVFSETPQDFTGCTLQIIANAREMD